MGEDQEFIIGHVDLKGIGHPNGNNDGYMNVRCGKKMVLDV